MLSFGTPALASGDGGHADAVAAVLLALVIILLLEVGLESAVQGMMKVGASSLLVAVLGVLAPFVLGFAASWLFIKELPGELSATVPAAFNLTYGHMFVGAVLCATSVGMIQMKTFSSCFHQKFILRL